MYHLGEKKPRVNSKRPVKKCLKTCGTCPSMMTTKRSDSNAAVGRGVKTKRKGRASTGNLVNYAPSSRGGEVHHRLQALEHYE